MLTIHRYINTPVSSNTYILTDDVRRECIIIDPGTNDCQVIINNIRQNNWELKFILLTHGDFDHTWGVNTLKAEFPSIQLVASRETARLIAIPQNYFNALYYNKKEYYSIEHVDVIIEDYNNSMQWLNNTISFIQVPGHTSCSNLILINDLMFSGDTILKNTKPFIQKKHGGNKEEFKQSVQMILDRFQDNTEVYPGHGDKFIFGEVRDYYKDYIETK